MSATSLKQASVDILLYQNDLRDWRKPDGSEVSSTSDGGRATVHLLQEPEPSFRYRIYALRVNDNKPLVNQIIHENFHYKVATPVFHQWKNEEKQVIGLNFINAEDAQIFSTHIKRIVESLSVPQYQQINASNGVYQDPQNYYQQTNNRDVDQESIGSGNSNLTNYRQPQKSSYSSLQSTGTLNQQQRRCSQGSSGSSGTPSSSNIYATTQPSNGFAPPPNGQLQQASTNGLPPVKAPAPPPAPPLPPQQINGTLANNNKNGSAPISKTAPPPPPLPTSLADQLKSKTLRKTSTPAAVTKTPSDAAKTPQPKTSLPGTHPDFLSELAAKFNNKNNGKNCNADNISTSSSSGVSTASSNLATSSDTSDSCNTIVATKKAGETTTAPKPWTKPNGNITAGITSNANGSLDSPKGQRKITSSNSIESSNVTVADLEKFKQDILIEVNKTKQEVSEMRQEIAKIIKTQNEMFEAIRAGLQR